MRTPKHVYLNPFFRLCRSVSTQDHVFVVGPPRSGTTLLSNVVSNHSNFCSLKNETDLFGWRSNFLLFEGRAGRHSGEYDKLRKTCKDVVHLLDFLANECKEINGCNRFLEKTPQHVFHIGFITSHFPKAKIINIIRDPRDCYLSSKSNGSIAQKTPQSFAKYWKRCADARKKHGNHAAIIDIRYETFVNSPSQVLKQVMRHIGEEFEHNQIAPDKMSEDSRAHTDAFRLLGSPITAVSVGRWKHELNVNDAQIIKKIAEVHKEYFYN